MRRNLAGMRRGDIAPGTELEVSANGRAESTDTPSLAGSGVLRRLLDWLAAVGPNCPSPTPSPDATHQPRRMLGAGRPSTRAGFAGGNRLLFDSRNGRAISVTAFTVVG